jgi:uncharacterized iron-regulated membrane protein
MEKAELYRTIWRWHFYAGLLVMPAILVLSLSGALYLFKPQVERWEERAFHNLPVVGQVTPSEQLAAAGLAFPGARTAYYRLPERTGDAALVRLLPADGSGPRDVFVSPQGRVLGSLDPDDRIIAIDRRLHGQLLLGPRGSWLVELAASWAIVMIVTGLYLWWPRGGGLGGAVWPRLAQGGRQFWRDLHAVAGFWVAGLALVLLFTGLPWASVWGSAFKAVREEAGWMRGPQDWTIGGQPPAGEDRHAGHGQATMAAGMSHGASARRPVDPAMFDRMVADARAARLAFPALVVPPGAPAGEGGTGKPSPDWIVKSEAQDRPLRVVMRYEAGTGRMIAREGFAERHPIDKLVAYGVAWHEGQLFGWFNQLVGLLTAMLLVTITISGFVMWRRRKPEGLLGAPATPAGPAWPKGWPFRLLALFLLIWLPLFTASLVAIALFELLALPRLPRLAAWLGQRPRGTKEPARPLPSP